VCKPTKAARDKEQCQHKRYEKDKGRGIDELLTADLWCRTDFKKKTGN